MANSEKDHMVSGAQLPEGQKTNSRLEHAESIRAVNNLEVEDFKCRYLVTDDIWIPLGENLLIEWFSPLWNNMIDGFGIHDPGKGRYQQRMSTWDTLHPGRSFAGRLQPNDKNAQQIIAALKTALQKRTDR